MIKTFVPTSGSGFTFFTRRFRFLEETIESSTITAQLLFVSDKVTICQEWKAPYQEMGSENSVVYKVIEQLINRNIVEESNLFEELSAESCQNILSTAIYEFLRGKSEGRT